MLHVDWANTLFKLSEIVRERKVEFEISRRTSVELAIIDISSAKCWLSMIAVVKIGGTIDDKKTRLWNSYHLSLFVKALTIWFDRHVTWGQETV